MQPKTIEMLEELRRRFKARQFGKIAQKLLAITFAEGGWTPTEREVQGVDIDVIGPQGEKYGIEVKTTERDSVELSSDNVDGLRREWENDGYQPTVAVLRLTILEDWIIARLPPTELRPETIPIRRLRPYRVQELEQLVQSNFDDIVTAHYDGTLRDGGRYLDSVLDSL